MFASSSTQAGPSLEGELFPMSSAAVTYARENQKRFLDELKDLLRIPSISTAEEHKDDVRKAAEVVASDLKNIGFEHVETIATQGHPLVYADWLHVEVRVTQRRGLARGVQPVRINQGMALRGNDLDMLEADALQIVGHHFGSFADVVFVLFGGADAGDAKQIFQLVEKPFLVLACVGNCCG